MKNKIIQNKNQNQNQNNNLFTIPLFSIWYVIITILFLVSQYLDIINWSPVWLFSPLWIPPMFCLCLVLIIYFLKFLIFIYENYYRHKK